VLGYLRSARALGSDLQLKILDAAVNEHEALALEQGAAFRLQPSDVPADPRPARGGVILSTARTSLASRLRTSDREAEERAQKARVDDQVPRSRQPAHTWTGIGKPKRRSKKSLSRVTRSTNLPWELTLLREDAQ
jgi:hypothetical protein